MENPFKDVSKKTKIKTLVVGTSSTDSETDGQACVVGDHNLKWSWSGIDHIDGVKHKKT